MFDDNKIPKELIKGFKEGQCIFFVGAGLSVGSGFPVWGELLKGLIELSNSIPHISKEKVKEYKKLIKDPSKYLFIAEDLKIELGEKFSDHMFDLFTDSTKKPTKNHELIVKIKTPLVITINYDSLIEQAYNKVFKEWPNVLQYSQSKQAANNFWKNNFFILKAHGDAKSDIDSIIISQKDYRKTLYREVGYKSLLQSIFTSKSVVFLGVSLTDPEFNQMLDFLHDSFHGGGAKHYALIESKHYTKTLARRYFDDLNINTITYENTDGNHSEITDFLQSIHAKTK
jgi:hypothetical protein